jgi:hypothetical protein
MAGRRSAKSWAKAVLESWQDCDAALEHHLHENYRGPLALPSFPQVHLALCCANMDRRDRVLDRRDGPLTVAEVIEEFGLGPFLPLFDRQEGARFARGAVVRYGNEHWSYTCRVIGRREVTPFAMLRLEDWELFVETLDGETTGFVGESEVEAVADGEAVRT